MRFAAVAGSPAATHSYRLGLVVDSEIRLLEESVTLLELLRAGSAALAEAGERARRRPEAVVDLATARLVAPLPQPPTVRDFMTFERHVIGAMGRGDETNVPPEWFEIPTFYFTNPYAVVGPHDDVPIAPGSQRFDFELEIAAVIGDPGTNLSVGQAERHVAGYSIFVDWSARDIQLHEMRIGLGPAKGKDTASTLGPFFVTADEMAERRHGHAFDVDLRVLRNGVQFGSDNLAHMAWSFAELVAYASRGTWVRPGDVLGSGTCADGCLGEAWGRHGLDAATPLAVGDLVEVQAELLGSTRNRIVAAAPVHPVPPARRLATIKSPRS